jgi:RNA polymerase sigma-70 factor, ECF subfamily
VQNVIPIDRAPVSGAHRLLRNSAVCRRLERRGVSLQAAQAETVDNHRARIETALMALFRDGRGDDDFQALYEFAGPGVLRQISMGLRGQGARLDPQELCQDAFVNIYRYAGSFRDDHPRSFKAWAQAISRNIIRRHISKRARPSLQDLPDGVSEPADGRVGPQACASLCEQRESLLRAWSLLLLQYAAAYRELSPRDRRALELVEVENKSYAEACEVLGVGMSNMKMIMFRARKRIRARITAAMGAHEDQREARLVG